MTNSVADADLTQDPKTILVNLINANNLVTLPTPITVAAASFGSPQPYGDINGVLNTMVVFGTTDPATYGTGTVNLLYTRVDISKVPAAQPAIAGTSSTTNGTASTTGTGLATAFAGAGVTLAASDLTVNGTAVAAATYTTGASLAAAITTASGIAGFATFNATTNEIDFVNTTNAAVAIVAAGGAAGLGFPASVPAAVTTTSHTVADAVAALNATYHWNIQAADLLNAFTDPMTANADGSYSVTLNAAINSSLIYTGNNIFTFGP